MLATKSFVRPNPIKLRVVIEKSPKYKVFSKRIADRVKTLAILIFVSQQRPDNEWRLSETTPPKYIASFRLDWHQPSITWRIVNSDPAWNLVEFGAHAGGETRVLRYRPLGRALDGVAAGGG